MSPGTGLPTALSQDEDLPAAGAGDGLFIDLVKIAAHQVLGDLLDPTAPALVIRGVTKAGRAIEPEVPADEAQMVSPEEATLRLSPAKRKWTSGRAW
jgi:hypothetical protein